MKISWYIGHGAYWAKVNDQWYQIYILGPYMGGELMVTRTLWKELDAPVGVKPVDLKRTSWIENNMMDHFNYNPGYLFDPLWNGRIM